MKKILIAALLTLPLYSAHSQEEGVEQPAAAPEAQQEVVVGNTDSVIKPVKPRSRMRQTNPMAPPNESSSFIGDPDNLDPLNPNRDNLKDDNEPVLEDIKDILNAKKKKKVEKPAETPVVAASTDATAAEPPPPEVAAEPAPAPAEPPPPVVEAPPPAPEPAPAPVSSSLNADEPDYALEKKFNDIFKRYNINPTPNDIWAAASSKQPSRLYEVQKGDTLWSISEILFGDPNFWPKIWSLNKDGILNPHFINPKLKIFFYEGTEENSPTLTIGEQPPVGEAPAETASNEVEEKFEDDPPASNEPVIQIQSSSGNSNYVPPTTKPEVELPPPPSDQFIEESMKVERKKYTKPTPLPPSLPGSYNPDYYGGKKQVAEIRIDLGDQPYPPFIIKKDIVITDTDVETEVKINNPEIYKERCVPGRVFKDIEYDDALLSEYDIYEKLDGVSTENGHKYAYRMVGTAMSHKDLYLKVTSCLGVMSDEFVIMPKNKMKELATQEVSDVVEVKLIGGPDIKKQSMYSSLNYAYVDFGAQKFEEGQEFKTLSDTTDNVNGTFKVISKYGSYAVVVITSVSDLLEIGDKVVTE